MRSNLKMIGQLTPDLRTVVLGSTARPGRARDSQSPMVSVEGVSVRFGTVRALDDVSLRVSSGEIICLLGPSGSGKSTLLRVVAGLERPTTGRVCLEGREVDGPGVCIAAERRRVGMVFQDYALFPHLTVADNVAFGLKGRDGAVGERTVRELLERVGLSRHQAAYPHMLSGGERQRVALARALAPQPRVLLMDEPFSSLDDRLRDRVRRETIGLLRDLKTTTVVVTHDPAEAIGIADRIALLCNGRILQYGAAEDLYARPTTAFAARFFSDVNELAGRCRGGRVDTPVGSFAAPGVPEHTSVRVCIRPQHLRVASAPTDVRARVVESQFLGEVERVVLDVAGLSTPLSLRVYGRSRLTTGESIYLDVDASGVVVVPDEGR